ncbi:hypothetical protein [Stackebrandtia soli]|uniref:hypothetical protein n=1 Tax=Stackebrandtia soli TaxID=1892856 RepID=UPI0039EC122E
MAHVFAHPTGSGASVELASFHQDTPGISGSAEKTDAFGLAAVTSYRASRTAPIGAVRLDGYEQAGMALVGGRFGLPDSVFDGTLDDVSASVDHLYFPH